MRGRQSTVAIYRDEQTRLVLQQWLRCRHTPLGRARSARALLLLEQGYTYIATAKLVGLAEHHIRKWAKRFLEHGVKGLSEKPRPGRRPVFLREVALHIVKLACERPDHFDTSLSQWDCTELARQFQADGLVQAISPRRSGGSCLPTSSNHSDSTFSSRRKLLVMSSLTNWSALSLSSTPGR